MPPKTLALTCGFAGLLLSCTHAVGNAVVADAGSGAEAGAATVMVRVGPLGAHSFLPATVTVPVGTTIQWFWVSAGHTVTSGADGVADGLFCSPGDLDCAAGVTSDVGTFYEHTFDAPGTYPYFCVPHYSVGMKGTIVVQ